MQIRTWKIRVSLPSNRVVLLLTRIPNVEMALSLPTSSSTFWLSSYCPLRVTSSTSELPWLLRDSRVHYRHLVGEEVAAWEVNDLHRVVTASWSTTLKKPSRPIRSRILMWFTKKNHWIRYFFTYMFVNVCITSNKISNTYLLLYYCVTQCFSDRHY